ncbi:hypothetical protein OVY01_12290 [Robbsia sp. Bb-Pol-6]|uniref:Uncharacterized protein n=1 Tax=Robbsia betulipollinis TaxID=2981849 RepID=A0ABT3ZNH0_9BURK|nr:hypothetical protein [Robbsia betulipollinis]MCY0388002.1 hypothetical protein [Robbsia betulipollinis]
MIKNFIHTVNGQNLDFCATLGDGPEGRRAIISTVQSPETLVIMEAEGALSALKVRLESPEAMLDDAIDKAKEGGLIDRAIETGTIQNGRL